MTQKTIPIFQVDAFTDKIFAGNPAACCPLHKWLPDNILQAIAAENNLAETAFWVAENDLYHLRWFTPVAEVELCGHATLAAGHVLFSHLGFDGNLIRFQSRSGILTVCRKDGRLEMDFPAVLRTEMDFSEKVAASLGRSPVRLFKGPDVMAVFETEAEVRALKPDFAVMSGIETRGIIATAPGENSDFISRFFAPRFGIPEDPVTGSAHCMMAPYWARQLDKDHLQAIQCSPRGGTVECEVKGDRVLLRGNAVTYLQGKIFL